nr:hypothetical protein [Agreia pratensis]
MIGLDNEHSMIVHKSSKKFLLLLDDPWPVRCLNQSPMGIFMELKQPRFVVWEAGRSIQKRHRKNVSDTPLSASQQGGNGEPLPTGNQAATDLAVLGCIGFRCDLHKTWVAHAYRPGPK